MHNAQRALVALVVAACISSHASQVRADAVSDQKQVLKKAGVKFDNTSNKCTFFVKADAERALRGPVVYQPSEIDPTSCSWARASDPAIGVNVGRSSGNIDVPENGKYATSQVHHLTGVGQDAYTSYLNAGSGGVYEADILTAKGVTTVTLTEKAGNAATALAIAKSMMNR